MRWIVGISVLIVAGAAWGTGASDVDAFFHFAAGTTSSLDPAAQAKLKAATADFQAVIEGRPPEHATQDTESPLPADGGTSFWIGPGYRLTIVKSLDRIAGVDGYTYGPILDLSDELGVGNSLRLSRVTFYPREKLHELLAK